MNWRFAMRFIRAGLRPALGVFLIAHGLAHAVMPLRGWMDPERLTHDFMPLVLYSVAVLGFTSAGVGMFGVRPFKSIVRPAMVVASAYSLVAIFVMGHGDLWWGAQTDVVLFIVGLTGLYRKLPEPTLASGPWHVARVVAGLAVVLYAAAAVLLWPLHRDWGSQPDEHAMQLPGDWPDRNPAL